MNIDKEIFWESISSSELQNLIDKAVCKPIVTSGLSFEDMGLELNVSYDNLDFNLLLKEKFKMCSPVKGEPHLIFLPDHGRLGFQLPHRNYGYVSEDTNRALVLASSFGVFKSVISGYASMLMAKQNYVPAHSSVMSINDFGLLFMGGSAAGKTTTLLNLIDWAIYLKKPFKVLTDDWAIVKRVEKKYVAESFDPSISLQQRVFDENPHLCFAKHEQIQRKISVQKKISLSPDDLYNCQAGSNKISVNAVVLLCPEKGDKSLHEINPHDFARMAVDTAYHYPYVATEQIKKHLDFWEKLAKDIPVFFFYTRGAEGQLQSIDCLKELV